MATSFSMPSPCFCFLLFAHLCISFAFFSSPTNAYGASYKDYCSSIVPESIHFSHAYDVSLPYFLTRRLIGGYKLLGKKTSSQNQSVYDVTKSVRFPIEPKYYRTGTEGVYKVVAWLYIDSTYRYYVGRNSSYGGSYYRSTSRWSCSIRSFLSGFWSKNSGKLGMVGPATWHHDERMGQTEGISLDVVLKLNYGAIEHPNIYAGVVSGTFESATSTDDSDYFDPLSIFHFPGGSNYGYSSEKKELNGGISEFPNVPKNQSLALNGNTFCSMFSWRTYELWYATECRRAQNCSPLVGDNKFLPRFMSFQPIQCSTTDSKIWYIIKFQNRSSRSLYLEEFDLNSTLVGEASWDDTTNQLLAAACRILNPRNHFGDPVGDCSIRFSLRYPSIWNIRNVARIVGQIWTNKTGEESEHFRKIELKSAYHNGELRSVYRNREAILQGLSYEYTERDRVSKLCVAKRVAKKGKYPNEHSYDMMFDVSVKNSKGQKFAWAGATPLSVGNALYKRNYGEAVIETEQISNVTLETISISKQEHELKAPSNISYKISINPFPGVRIDKWFRTMNWSMNPQGQVIIIAEGVYDPETGHLCMVGCRELLPLVSKSTNESRDCEIHVNFQFASLTAKRGEFVEGTIKSTRSKADLLHFDDLRFSSTAFSSAQSGRSIWRMDIEITMVLISNTLLCIFLGLQLVHMNRNPDVISRISVLMLLILSLGHLVPLVLNFDAIFFKSGNRQKLWVSTWGWLEANEVATRVVTMVAFLLQIRLLQLVWTTKDSENGRGSWLPERKIFFFLLPMYAVGGLFTIIWYRFRTAYGHQPIPYASYNVYPNFSLWEGLRSYAGLILDCMLLPQVMLNAFRSSPEKLLCIPFYMGIPVLRLVPHAYDLYRAHNYPTSYVRGTYYYANPAADFYSAAWDIITPCAIAVLAAIIFLQQRHGGHRIVPKRFRELELYEKVPAAVNNQD